MESRYVIEGLILIIIILAGGLIKRKTRRFLKIIEDNGTVVKGNEFKGRIIDARDKTEKGD